MSEYIFQEETMTNLADAFRYKLKDTENLSVEDMRKLVYLMHYDLDGGVTFYDDNNEPVYSYSINEANTLTELPTIDPKLGYVGSWSHTLKDINSTTTPQVVTAVYDRLMTEFVFVISNTETEVSFDVTNYSTGDLKVEWGDGNIENPVIENATTSTLSHTYLQAGGYTARIYSDNSYLRFKAGDGKAYLKRVILGKHNDQIQEMAFFYCDSLISVTIPNSVTSIGRQAFYECPSLTSINIPDSVTSIGNDVFSGCTSLTSVVVDENNEYYQSIDGNLYTKDGKALMGYAIGKEDASFVIPDSVTSISHSAFYNCTSLTNIIIPDSVTSIGDNAFSHCTSLTSIEIPDSVTSIGERAFYGCSSLTSIEIPDSVTSIDKHTFWGCTNLENISIGNNVNNIGSSAFYACSFTSIIIPESVTSIGRWAFDGCNKLTTINYCGSEAQWNAIDKDAVWYGSASNYTIVYNYSA